MIGLLTKPRLIGAGVVLILVGFLYFRIGLLKGDLQDAEEAINKLENEKTELLTVIDAHQLVTAKLQKANQDCVLQKQINQERAEAAVQENQQAADRIKRKYEQLKKTGSISICGDAVLDHDLLLQLQHKADH